MLSYISYLQTAYSVHWHSMRWLQSGTSYKHQLNPFTADPVKTLHFAILV